MAEAITLLKKAAASKKIAKQQVMEAIDVLEKAKLDVRAAEQVFWGLLLQHAIHTSIWLPSSAAECSAPASGYLAHS